MTKELINLIPINKVASHVISKGFHWEDEGKHQCIEWDIKPYTKPVPMNLKRFKNLIGFKADRIKIIGFLGFAKIGDSRGSKWLGKCVCGKYVSRNQKTFMKSIRNKTENSCQQCKKIDYFRNKRK